MTIATNIKESSDSASEAVLAANQLRTQITQDWLNEATFYTFTDESVLIVSGEEFYAFDSMTAATDAIEADDED
jgi:hypothetical protein